MTSMIGSPASVTGNVQVPSPLSMKPSLPGMKSALVQVVLHQPVVMRTCGFSPDTFT